MKKSSLHLISSSIVIDENLDILKRPAVEEFHLVNLLDLLSCNRHTCTTRDREDYVCLHYAQGKHGRIYTCRPHQGFCSGEQWGREGKGTADAGATKRLRKPFEIFAFIAALYRAPIGLEEWGFISS